MVDKVFEGMPCCTHLPPDVSPQKRQKRGTLIIILLILIINTILLLLIINLKAVYYDYQFYTTNRVVQISKKFSDTQ